METARDVAVVVLVVIHVVWLLALCVVGFVVLRLLLRVAGKAPQVLDTATTAARTVEARSRAAEEAVGGFVIRAAALGAGLSRFVSVLSGGPRRPR